jgi:hypothetical protein
MNGKKSSKLRLICSVSEMAKTLEHSRARFYQLQREGVYPPPLYDLRTRRPFFDTRLQQACIEVRETGVGYNGQYVLFYSPREESPPGPKRQSNGRETKNTEYKELAETLKLMGLEVTVAQVAEAVGSLYPHGMEKQDPGVVIREVFRLLRKSVSE